MAVRVRRPTRDNVYLTIWTDERSAGIPAVAERYCKEHGLQVTASLLGVLVNED